MIRVFVLCYRTAPACTPTAGFTKRSESPYDPFGAGHSSTSISAALGMAVGRDVKGRKNNVVAVRCVHPARAESSMAALPSSDPASPAVHPACRPPGPSLPCRSSGMVPSPAAWRTRP